MARSTRWQMCGTNLTCTASLSHPSPILSMDQPIAPPAVSSSPNPDLRMHVIHSTSTCARTYGTFMFRCMLACRLCIPISSGRNGHREATHRAGLRSRPQGGWLRDPLGMGPLVTGGEGERCWFLRPIECHLLGPCCSPAPSLVRIRVGFSFCVRLY